MNKRKKTEKKIILGQQFYLEVRKCLEEMIM